MNLFFFDREISAICFFRFLNSRQCIAADCVGSVGFAKAFLRHRANCR